MPTWQASTGTAHRWASPPSAANCPPDATQRQVEDVIDELNADPACTGYIVQLPLPRHLDAGAVLERMDPAKDADGLHPVNLGRLVLGVGITRTDNGLVGDIYPDAAQVAGWLAPMPGGVGPMTRAMLLANVVEAAERNANTV